MKTNQRGLLLLKPILIVVLVLILGGLYYSYYSSHKTKHSGQSPTLPSGWNQYESRKYGFKFIYPDTWGNPTVNSLQAQKASHLSVGFSEGASVIMESEGVKEPSGCTNNCNPILTREYIQKQLHSKTNNYIKSSSYYYATLVNTSNKIELLTVDGVVNLPKLNISAAEISYPLKGSSPDCPDNKFITSSDKKCISENNLNDALKVLNSLSSI